MNGEHIPFSADSRKVSILDIGRDTVVEFTLFFCFLSVVAIFLFIWLAPPTVVTITAGPEGSIFHTNAIRYSRILANHGVTLKVLTSHGSQENLERLTDPKSPVDIGLIVGGVTNAAIDKLVSLGSISYQPILVFYRGATLELLSGLAGKRLSIGPVGSGTRSLALALLEANGIHAGGSTTFLDGEPQQSAEALLGGTVDAIFLMGEDASLVILRELLHTPDVHLLSFSQAKAYSRRINYLNVLELPEGSIDLGKNIPSQDIHLVGPTVELIARKGLAPALSDLLLEAVREVHGRAGIFQHKGEFPAPLEHDFRISPDAARFYKSGKTFFYRYLPFWLGSVISRIVFIFVPMIVVLIPLMRNVPLIYQWRVRSRIYRWYRALLDLERDWISATGMEKDSKWQQRLDEIERGVNQLKVPTFAADLYYDLRGHIDFVRQLVNRHITR